MNEEFDDLIDEVVTAAQDLTSRYEWCDGVEEGERELNEAKSALQARIRELEGNIEAYEHDLPLLRAAERIAELERAQRWTSIETLPEQDGVYLGWCKQEKLHAMFVFRVEWTVGVDNRITHWMPLPSIPESEDK